MALFPVASLVAANLGQARPTVGVRFGVLSVLMALLATGLLRPLSPSWHGAAALATFGLLLFYSYGHVYNALRDAAAIGPGLGRHRYLVPAFGLLAIAIFVAVRRWSPISASTTVVLNVTSTVLLAVPLLQITVAGSLFGGQPRGALELEAAELAPAGKAPWPDVYYIVLDAYTRGDTLRESFEFDNQDFLGELRSLGFYVAECGVANYAQTELSLAATLNGGYLESLLDQPKAEWARSDLWPLLRHSQVRTLFDELDYTIVAAETGYYWSEWEDADRYLAPEQGWFSGLNAWEGTLLRSTAAWAAIDALPSLPAFLSRDLDRSVDAHRERVGFVLDALANLADEPGPKFAFIHLVSPHRPFVFDAEGDPVDDNYTWTFSELGLNEYRLGYREQVAYLNRRMEDILSKLIQHAHTPPVIVVQGDHGPEEGSQGDRMRILNALYLSGRSHEELYPTISSVNTFRAVLNTVFGAELPMLSDESYYSTYGDPFDFVRVEDVCAD